MTYQHVVGDIFTTTLPAIAHGVNLEGNMGSGIAAIIKRLYPEVLPPYEFACEENLLQPGEVLPVHVASNPDVWIYNLASQVLQGANARMDLIEQSFTNAFDVARELGHKGFAIPRIGSNVGGLNWNDVRPLLERIAEENADIHVEIWSLPDADKN